jgi:16S rRNA (uracil1498-N3)-methyltransferase
MPQFFIKTANIDNDSVIISDKEDIKHISSVLRCQINDELILVDSNEYTYKVIITDIQKGQITTKVVEKLKSFRKLSLNLTLAQSVLKASAQDMLVQKATELGVKKVIPIISKYTVVKFDSDKDKEQKVSRWQKIALEACKQCERADMPVMSGIISFDNLLNNIDDYDLTVICVERNTEMSIKEFLRSNQPDLAHDCKVLALIGPEGGWSEKEIDMFKQKGLKLITLGNLIFRAETAAINVLSDIIYEYEL